MGFLTITVIVNVSSGIIIIYRKRRKGCLRERKEGETSFIAVNHVPVKNAAENEEPQPQNKSG